MSRQLLQNIRDSGCVDMESLCILAHENVGLRNGAVLIEHGSSLVQRRFGKSA